MKENLQINHNHMMSPPSMEGFSNFDTIHLRVENINIYNSNKNIFGIIKKRGHKFEKNKKTMDQDIDITTNIQQPSTCFGVAIEGLKMGTQKLLNFFGNKKKPGSNESTINGNKHDSTNQDIKQLNISDQLELTDVQQESVQVTQIGDTSEQVNFAQAESLS